MRRPRANELKHTLRFDLPGIQQDTTLMDQDKGSASSANERTGENSGAKKSMKTKLAKRAVSDKWSLESQINGIDRLSNLLRKQAEGLSQTDATLEQDLRPQMLECLKGCSGDDRKLGELLYQYREIYKSGRQWTFIAEKIGKAIDRSTRTIYRMVDRHTGAKAKITKRKDLNRQERQDKREIAARLAIRTFLENLPDKEKQSALSRALSEEAHQVWGNPESFNILITPQWSRFTIDGRLRQQETSISEDRAA